MKILFFYISLFSSLFCFSQNNTDSSIVDLNGIDTLFKSKKEYECFDCDNNYIRAQFPGGEKTLFRTLYTKIELHDSLKTNCYETFIIIQFEIDTLGKVKNPEVLQSNCEEINETIKQVILLLPNFIPARTNNKPVTSTYRIPLRLDFMY